MILLKLALRNVRRQIGDYLVYFVTVACTVSLLFALCSMMFSELIFNFSAAFKMETRIVSAFLAVVLAVVSAIVLGYGCLFLLRRRKKEFGTYLTLGMTRGNILTIFMGEMLFTFLFSLAAGLGLGTVVYQMIVAGVSAFMQTDYAWADYTAGGFILTVVMVGIIFLLTSAAALAYLKFETIARLLQGESKTEKTAKHPKVWLVVTAVSAVVLVISLFVLVLSVTNTASKNYASILVGSSAAAFLSIVFLYIGAMKCGIYYLLKNKRFSSRGTRTFTLRQLSGRMSADSVIFGVIAVLLSVVVAGGNIFITAFGTQAADAQARNPYTVGVSCPYDETGALTKDVLPGWMEEFGEVEEICLYDLFAFREDSLVQYLSDDAWIMRESDYKMLAEMAGEKPGEVGENGALLVCNGTTIDEFEEKQRQAEALIGKLQWNTAAFSLTFTGVSPTRLALAVDGPDSYFLAVPDAVVDIAESSGAYSASMTCCAVNYAAGTFDEEGLDRFLSQKNREEVYQKFLEEHPRHQGITNRCFLMNTVGGSLSYLLELAAPWLLIVLFVTLAFALLSMAVLALKSLAAVSEDRRRYRLLYLAGASRRQTFASLAVQIALYFFLPFAVPILLNIPLSFICVALKGMMGAYLTDLQVVGYTAMFSGVILLFYALYGAITFLVARLDVGRELNSAG